MQSAYAAVFSIEADTALSNSLTGCCVIHGTCQHYRTHHACKTAQGLPAFHRSCISRHGTGQHSDHCTHAMGHRVAHLRTMARRFGAKRRDGAAAAGIVAMLGRQIGLRDRRHSTVVIACAYLVPSCHGVGERALAHLRDQILLGSEMAVEPAVSEPGFPHEIGDPDPVSPHSRKSWIATSRIRSRLAAACSLLTFICCNPETKASLTRYMYRRRRPAPAPRPRCARRPRRW